jgi:Transposase DDE domain
MSSKAKQAKQRRQENTFVGCLRKFLTPEVLKQAHKAHCRPHRDNLWTIHPLLLTLLAFTWCAGDSQTERFETARAFTIALRPKRKRPGKTLSSYHKALARLPMPVLRAIAAALRTHFLGLFAGMLCVNGWLPFGCDGSRLECPRSDELEKRLGEAGKPDSAPTMWLTALVHLPSGLLWSWWLGKGTASERAHLVKLLLTLPAAALVVCDAGYTGYVLAATMMTMTSQVSFLIRVSSNVRLYALENKELFDVDGKPLEQWREGEVYYWPLAEQRQNHPPLRVRLLCVRDAHRKVDVWLLTNVMDAKRLSLEMASKFYKMRWENEGFFRTYKRTLKKVKLSSRSVRLVHREVEGSLLAVQLLLAQGALGMLAVARSRSGVSSPRGVLREIRKEIEATLRGRARAGFLKRLSEAKRERRNRTSNKQKRVWPRRKPHKQPGAPKLLPLSDELKALLHKILHAT